MAKKPCVRLVWSDGERIGFSGSSRHRNRLSMASGFPQGRPMHSHERIGRNNLATSACSVDDRLPVLRRDLSPKPPSPDRVGHLINLASKNRDLNGLGPKDVENVPDVLHGDRFTEDRKSRQVGTTRPVPTEVPDGTIRPMGRPTGTVSPARFKKEFCSRLRLARISARMEPEEVAEHMGVAVDTWRRYELRTLLPHHLIPKAAYLFGVDLEFFYVPTRGDSQQERRA